MWYLSIVYVLLLVVVVSAWTGNEVVVPVKDSHVVSIGTWAVDAMLEPMTSPLEQVETSDVKSATHQPTDGGDVYRVTQVVTFTNGSSLILYTESLHPTLDLSDAVMQHLRILEPTHPPTGFGSTTLIDTTSKSVGNVRRFALHHLRQGIPSRAVVTLLRAQQQVVQGIVYKLDIEVRELNKQSRILHVEVLQDLSLSHRVVLERAALE